jgi:hypothetical protein
MSAADHEHLAVAAQRRFVGRRRVVDAGPLEALEVVDRQPLVASARRDDHAAAGDLATVGQLHHHEAVLHPQARDRTRRVESCPEALGLDRGARGELSTGDPVGEAHVVLDARAGAGLTTRVDRVERHRLESFGRAVDRGGQPSGAAADDDQVERVAGGRVERQPELFRELAR